MYYKQQVTGMSLHLDKFLHVLTQKTEQCL